MDYWDEAKAIRLARQSRYVRLIHKRKTATKHSPREIVGVTLTPPILSVADAREPHQHADSNSATFNDPLFDSKDDVRMDHNGNHYIVQHKSTILKRAWLDVMQKEMAYRTVSVESSA